MRCLWPFVLGGVALGLDAYVIAGLLPAIATDLGTRASTVGLGVAAFTGGYAFSGPLLAGRAGRRAARGLTVALLVFTAGNVVTALAPNAVVFIAARLVAGAAAGLYSPLSSAVAASMVDPARRGRALALVLSGLAIGTVLGVPVGLLLADHAGWRAAIWLITLVGTAALVGVALSRGAIPNVDAPSAKDRMRSLARPPTVLTVTVTLLTGVASLGLYTFVRALLSGSSLAQHQTLAIWVWGLGGAAGALTIGRIVDASSSSLRITRTILLLLVATYGGIAIGPPGPPLLALLFCWGALGWASLAPQQHTLLESSPEDGATAVAANSSANYLGAAVGSLAGSALLALGITGTGLAVAALAPALLAVGAQLVRLRVRPHAVPSSPS